MSDWLMADQQGRGSALHRLASAIHHHQQVRKLTGNLNPSPTHNYEPDPQSGAGNCVCGADEYHQRHPHWFTARRNDADLCLCGLGPARHSTYVPESAWKNWMRDD